MALKNLSSIIQYFRYLKSTDFYFESEIKKELENIFKEFFSFIPPCLIKYKNKTLFISSKSSVIKNEIFLKQDLILESFKKRFKEKSPEKIMFSNALNEEIS